MRQNSQYEYTNEPNLLWAAKLVQEAEFPQYTYNDSVEQQDIDITKILNYPVDQEPLDFDAYSLKASTQLDGDSPQTLPFADSILVEWHGLSYFPPTALFPSAGMFSMTFRASSVQGEAQYFTAADRANKSDFKIAGECRAGKEPGTASLTFQRSFPARLPIQFYSGTWNAAAETITGTFGFEENAAKHGGRFVLKRVRPESMCFWPAPVQLEANKARALWGFAIAAVRDGVRRDRWSWSFFKERRDNRRRFIELYIRSNESSTQFGTPLNGAERQELLQIKKTFTAADSRFYHSLAEQQIRATPNHKYVLKPVSFSTFGLTCNWRGQC